jgi:hypothetical protein
MKITNTHYGQKRAYGDSFYEYLIESEEPISKESIIELVKENKLYKYGNILLKRPSREETDKVFGLNFATYLSEVRNINDKKWFVVIISPSTH